MSPIAGVRPCPSVGWLSLTLALALALPDTGCSTAASRVERAQFARHPAHESRMAAHPENGYVPTGVWRVRGPRGAVLYLAGTSHLIPESAIPFPSSYYAAYAESQIIYIEFDTDLSWWTKLRLMPRIVKWLKTNARRLVPPRGQTLANYLSAETLAELRQRTGKDFGRQPITPSFLLLQSEMGALEGGGDTPLSGVEEPFVAFAHRDHKPVRELDDGKVVAVALQVLDQLLSGYEADIARRGADAVIREALLHKPGDEADTVWRHGELTVALRAQDEVRKQSAELYGKAFRQRNHDWVEKLVPILRGNARALALIGVAHLPGEDGLLHLLQEAGFTAEQMYGVDRP